jgi:PQQ-dependent dehydrogenase (methanol/ethanol family)
MELLTPLPRAGPVLVFGLLIFCSCRSTSPESRLIAPTQAHGAVTSIPWTVVEDGDWPMPAKDYANTRFSGLKEITAGNVADLKLAWSFSTGLTRGHEAAPLVVDGTMYYVSPFPNLLFALDPVSGEKKWQYSPKPVDAAKGVACCDQVNRGATFYKGRIYYATLDNNLVAVDAKTGVEAFKTKLGDINIGETITMAPIVVKSKVLVGNSGGEFGVRGWISAVDAETGKESWRAYSTGPDKDVLIGPEFRPFYKMDQGKDLGMTTWPPDHWKIGGGNVWGWVQYDPGLDLIYYGTANAGPWNPEIRPGDNKWTAAIFARRPDNGGAIWAYQWTPHDVFDYDGVNESILVDLPIGGRVRKVLLRAERNGYFYVLDRSTGEILSAKPFVYTNVVKEIDLATGRPVEDTSKSPGFGRIAKNICPAVPGGKGWSPMAYSPKSGLAYIPATNLCNDIEGVEANYIAGTPYTGHKTIMYAGPGGNRGEFIGWDPVQNAKRWGIREMFPVTSGALATEGDVVFYGTMDRWFKAVDARTGQLLWKFRTGSGIVAPPMTYRGSDGKQYVAVADGVGGWAGSIVSAGLDGRDEYADKGYVNAMTDLPKHTGPGGTIYVFRLP